MIGLDTNVLVRYIMQDDPQQSAQASHAMERLNADEPGFISIVATVELAWVLDSCYALSRNQISDALEALLRTKELVVDRAESVSRATRAFRATKADLADCLIAACAEAAGCTHTLTFDRGAARHAGMQLLA